MEAVGMEVVARAAATWEVVATEAAARASACRRFQRLCSARAIGTEPRELCPTGSEGVVAVVVNIILVTNILWEWL